jgi:putative flippase GtrA
VLKKQIINFILIGIVNTLVGFSLYALFIFIGIKYIGAVLLATILGVLFNYITIGKFVFNTQDNTSIIKFSLVYTIVFFINIIVIKVFKAYNFNDYIAGFFALIPASIISFALNKYYVFKGKKNGIN